MSQTKYLDPYTKITVRVGDIYFDKTISTTLQIENIHIDVASGTPTLVMKDKDNISLGSNKRFILEPAGFFCDKIANKAVSLMGSKPTINQAIPSVISLADLQSEANEINSIQFVDKADVERFVDKGDTINIMDPMCSDKYEIVGLFVLMPTTYVACKKHMQIGTHKEIEHLVFRVEEFTSMINNYTGFYISRGEKRCQHEEVTGYLFSSTYKYCKKCNKDLG